MRYYQYSDSLISGGAGQLRDVLPTPDGGFIAVGAAYGVSHNGQSYGQDAWVIKVDSMGCLEPGCDVEWDSLLLPGLEVGASIGAEFGPVFFIGSYNQGLASATIPYRAAVDADVGVEVHKNVFIDLGLGFVSRQLLVRGADTESEYGQLSDTQWVGRLSLGVQF